MEHGMNCPHHADKDEACTCALTERTMHAAWRKRAEEAETRIAALEAQVKALTEERDSLQDAVDFLNTMNDEQDEWFTRIVNDHGGWHEDLPTGEAHIEEIIGNLKKDRDAQAEAVRNAGCFFCRDCDAVRCDTEILSKLRKIAEQAGKRQWWNVMVYIIELNGVALAAMREAVNANPIARAAVEGGKRED